MQRLYDVALRMEEDTGATHRSTDILSDCGLPAGTASTSSGAGHGCTGLPLASPYVLSPKNVRLDHLLISPHDEPQKASVDLPTGISKQVIFVSEKRH